MCLRRLTDKVEGLDGFIPFTSLLFLCGFLVSPAFIYLFVVYAGGKMDPMLVWNAIMSVLWIVTLHLLFRRTMVLHLCMFPFYLSTVMDLFLLVRFQSRLTSSYISIAFSDFNEAGGFFRSFPFEFVVGAVFLLGLYPFLVYSMRGVRLRAPLRVTSVLVVSLFFGYIGVVVRQTLKYDMEFGRACLDVLTHDLSAPVGALSQVGVTWALFAKMAEYTSTRNDFEFNASKGYDAGDEVYVLVIGESSRSYNWSLNGYERNTNPLLSERRNLVSFKNVITPAPHTRLAVPAMVSLVSIKDWRKLASQPSIVAVFGETGFETFWFSIQEISHWSGIICCVASDADIQRYHERSMDGVLIGEVRRVLERRKKPAKLFLALHTKGSHFVFTDRYPPRFNVFDDNSGSRKEHLVNTYDNSICYTDYIIDALIELLEKRDTHAVLFYASDHGENLLDDDRGYFGHAIGSEYDLHAAQVVWVSEKVKKRFPGKIKNLKNCSASKLSLSNVSHSMLDIAGISANGYKSSFSIFSDDFKEHVRFCRVRGVTRQYKRPGAVESGGKQR